MNVSLKDLFEQLMFDWNIRGIQIGDIQLYAINDLPINRGTIRKTIHTLKQADPFYVKTHLHKIKNSDVTSSNIRNFNKVNNAGENF